jgi:hypothetical protein
MEDFRMRHILSGLVAVGLLLVVHDAASAQLLRRNRQQTSNYAPSYPVYQSPTQVTSGTPYVTTTSGTTVYSTTSGPRRMVRLADGTTQIVSQPVYDQSGTIVGWTSGDGRIILVSGQGTVTAASSTSGTGTQTTIEGITPMVQPVSSTVSQNTGQRAYRGGLLARLRARRAG